MKLVVVGLGSMGKRRVRNLLANGIAAADIDGVDNNPARAEEAAAKYGITTHTDIAEVDLSTTDAFVISTPPDQHLPYARLAAENNCHMFIEASVLADGLAELETLVESRGVVAFPSCTMRFFAGPRQVRRLVEQGAVGRVLAWQYQSGQYLPDWHPWEPITEFYVSNRETGGCREIVPFEMVWLTTVFGPVVNVESRKAKRSDLPADIDDIYMLQTRHEDGTLGQLIVDVLSRTPVRDLRITGAEGTIEWDDSTKKIRVFRVASGEWEEMTVGLGTVEAAYINPEEPYIEEIRTYLECIRERRQPEYTLAQDLEMLDLLYQAERADDEGRRVEIGNQVAGCGEDQR